MNDVVRCGRTGYYGVVQSTSGQLVILKTWTVLKGAHRNPGDPWTFATQAKYLKPSELPSHQEKS